MHYFLAVNLRRRSCFLLDQHDATCSKISHRFLLSQPGTGSGILSLGVLLSSGSHFHFCKFLNKSIISGHVSGMSSLVRAQSQWSTKFLVCATFVPMVYHVVTSWKNCANRELRTSLESM